MSRSRSSSCLLLVSWLTTPGAHASTGTRDMHG
jgi:hypothetical protein